MIRVACLCAVFLTLSATLWTSPILAASPGLVPPPKHPKLAFELRRELSDTATVADPRTREREPIRREVVIDTTPRDTADVLSMITARGGRALGATLGSIDAEVPVDKLEQLAALSEVRYISPIHRLQKHSVTSEGLRSTAATEWHARGFRGRGIKVGVIDGSFADYPARQATGDLPSTLTTADFCSGRILAPSDEGAHGTAVAEIVFDMAPEASLYLICISGALSSLQSAVNYARAEGIRVINFSAGYPASSRGDGRGGAGTAEGIVADAVASGITWVNAAGNEAQRHWSGSFVPSGGRQWGEFAPGVDRQAIMIPYGAGLCSFLKWDEWPTATSDYDLFLFGSDPVTPVIGSDRPSVGAPPREAFCFRNFNPAETTFRLGIWRASGAGSPRIDLFVTGSSLDRPVAAGSVVEPATLGSVIAVGAACWQTGIIDFYSSRGPTIDGRIKPDIVGPSDVTTSTYGNASGCSSAVGFPGTSSSAPHVAGAAVLVLQANPTFTPAQVRSYLMATAADAGLPGPDNDYGSGLLKLGAGTPAPPVGGPCLAPHPGQPTAINYLPNVTKTLGGPNGFTTPFVVQNSGSVPADVEVEYRLFSDGSCVWRHGRVALAAGTSFAETLIDQAALPSDSQFSVIIRSFGGPIVSIVNEHQGSGLRAQAMSYVGFSEGATTVWVPNVVRRFFGYHTPLIVQNLGTATTTVTARFVPFDGGPAVTTGRTMQPGQSQFIEPNIEPALGDGRQYAATLVSAQPIAVVVNTQNDGPDVAQPVAYSTDGIAKGAFAVYGAYAAKNANNGGRAGTTSTIVVQNVGAAAITPSIAFTPLGGGSARRFTRRAPLPAGAAWVFDPRYASGDTASAFCAAATPECLTDGEFSFVANASGPIAAVVNVISPASAMGYSASVQPNTRYLLPNVTRALGGASGWTTPMLLQAVTATAATLTWRSFRGGSVITQTVPLPQGAAVRIDPRSVPGLADDTQYAVTIAGQVGGEPGTVNAIVMELAEGGDNAMIYEGFPVGAVPPGPNVLLTDVFYDGRVRPSEADEYVEFQNLASTPQDLNGWKITSAIGAQSYVFVGLTMQPGQICRLYTNEVHPEWCGVSWGRATAQWNNAGDRANLVDPIGKVVSSIGYGGR